MTTRLAKWPQLARVSLIAPVTLFIAAVTMCLAAEPREATRLNVSSENLSLRNEVERAIAKGLTWLEKHQDPKGFWTTGDNPAVTALALVAFQGRPGRDANAALPEAVKKGYDYLLDCIQPDGGIYRKDMPNYNTAVSMMALLAASRAEYKPILVKARQFIIGLQSDFGEPGKADDLFDGGIGYGNRYKHSDMSNTLLALEALYYSKPLVEDETLVGARDLNWAAAIQFIQNCQNLPEHNQQKWVADDPQNKGGFVYYPGNSMAGETNLSSGRVALRSYGSISYAGLMSYIYAGLKPEDPRVKAVFDWLRSNYTLDENPGMGPQGLFFYFHTMAKALTLADVDQLDNADGKRIHWRKELALRLINLQKANGSWANDNGRWWEKEPALVTAYAVISLELIQRRL
ncbi:MAG: terpene cyclase/mutase family protein [Verrucomicrobia bacterium]|nr:terpene cyclase/mutase family protein [Verrucomicrobiota bacterium]